MKTVEAERLPMERERRERVSRLRRELRRAIAGGHGDTTDHVVPEREVILALRIVLDDERLPLIRLEGWRNHAFSRSFFGSLTTARIVSSSDLM